MAGWKDPETPFLRGKVFGVDSNVLIECLVANVSHKGAEIYPGDRDVPKEFVLTIPARGESFYCERGRHCGEAVEVRFVTKGM